MNVYIMKVLIFVGRPRKIQEVCAEVIDEVARNLTKKHRKIADAIKEAKIEAN